MTTPPSYTDPETKEKLYGYSQTNLDGLRKAIYRVGFGFLIFMLLMVVFAWFVIDYFNIIDYVAYKIASKGCV